MTNSKMLGEAINEAGITIVAIARKMGISRESFYKKMNNETEFKASEICVIQKILNLSNSERDNIFFVQEVE